MGDQSDDDYNNQLILNYLQNKKYAKSSDSYTTTLSPSQEQDFRNWVKQNKVPFNPNEVIQDYDMRGFYQGLMNGDPLAQSAVDPNDNKLHYPDRWKTPYHQTFSSESQYAGKGAPSWNDKDQLVLLNGNIVFDDRNR